MKNSKDKNIIKLILIFIAYYLVSMYVPHLLPNYSDLINMLVKDIIMIVIAILIYFKDVKRDFGKFKRNNSKWKLVLWLIIVLIVWYLVIYFSETYFSKLINLSADGNNASVINYFNKSKYYAFFKIVIFTGIVETILFNLSFRKVFNNNIIFIIVSALVYTYFNYLFSGFNFKYILNPIVIRFIPCVLYNILYIKNDNNIVSLMFVIMLRNIYTFVILMMG